MESEFKIKVREYQKKRLENEELISRISQGFEKLIGAFWKKAPMLSVVEYIGFSPKELKNWIVKKAELKRLI